MVVNTDCLYYVQCTLLWMAVNTGRLYSTMDGWHHRKGMKSEGKAKVVAAAWGAEFIKYFAMLAILHQDDLKNRMNCTWMI